MTYPTVFISLANDGTQLTIEGNLALLDQFLTTVRGTREPARKRSAPRRVRSPERIHTPSGNPRVEL